MNLFDLKTWKSWIYICKYLLANEWQGYQTKQENHKKQQFEELPSLVYNINFFLDRDILQKLLFLNKNKDIVVDKKHYLYWFIYHVDLSHFVFYVVQCIVFVYKYLPMMDRLGFFHIFVCVWHELWMTWNPYCHYILTMLLIGYSYWRYSQARLPVDCYSDLCK